MGQISVYNSLDNSYTVVKGNGKAKDVLAEIGNYILIKEGYRVNSDYEIKENDILYARRLPRGVSTSVLVALGATVAATTVFVVGVVQDTQNKLNDYNDQLQKAKDKNDATKILPFLRGSKNQNALGKTIPYVMGETYFVPYLINSGFYSISGANGIHQYWNALLTSGYNNQKIKSVSIGQDTIYTFDQEEEDQDGIYTFHNSTYGDIELEIRTKGELQNNGLAQKTIGEFYGDEIKHEYGENPEELVKQLPENVQRVDVCIKFDGLREHEEDYWKARKVKIVPYWSNNADAQNPTWHSFTFQTVEYNTWQTMTQNEINTALTNGKMSQDNSGEELVYISNCPEIKISDEQGYSEEYRKYYNVPQKAVPQTQETNEIEANSNQTIRFVASHTFTAGESYGKNISIKLIRETPKLEDANAQETAVLEYINTYCYDAKTSTNAKLEACRPIEQPFRDQLTRIGIKFESNQNTENLLDEINIVTVGKTNKIVNGQVTEELSASRNPVENILTLLLSEFHVPSKYNSNELYLQSFTNAITYCNLNNLYCDYVVTEGIKKRDLIKKILETINGSLIINSDGLLEIVIDKAETNPVALLNCQSIKSMKYTKNFEKKLTGLKTTYTNGTKGAIDTQYFMLDNTHEYDQTVDRLGELSLDTVTTYEHAYKMAQRKLREQELQPRTVEVEVGSEGELYPLYSTIYLQMEQLKQGLCSSVIHRTFIEENEIVKIKIADKVTFESGKRYGIIIQAQNNSGKRHIYTEVLGTGTTNELTLVTPILYSGIYPTFQNELSFGLLDDDGGFTKLTNVMKIYDIKPSNNHGWTLTLKDYNPDIYETGTIPDYKSNITTRPTTKINELPVRQSDLLKSQIETNAYTEATAQSLSRRIDSIVTDVTVCTMDVTTAIFDVDGENKTVGVQEIETNIVLKQGETLLDFTVGEIELPNGWTYRIDGRKIIFTVGQGVDLKTGQFTIPIQYRDIVKRLKYVDENEVTYVDENGRPYYEIQYSNTFTQWDLFFTYIGSGNPIFLGTINNLNDVPTVTSIGNYFVWGGTNDTQTSLVQEGVLKQAKVYKYIGTSLAHSWEEDTDRNHLQIVLGDVLAIANADLEHNNTTVFTYLDNLTSNSVFTNLIIANEAFIQSIVAKNIEAGFATITELEAGNINIPGGAIKVGNDTLIENGKIKTNLIDTNAIKATSGFFKNIAVEGQIKVNNGICLNYFDNLSFTNILNNLHDYIYYYGTTFYPKYYQFALGKFKIDRGAPQRPDPYSFDILSLRSSGDAMDFLKLDFYVWWSDNIYLLRFISTSTHVDVETGKYIHDGVRVVLTNLDGSITFREFYDSTDASMQSYYLDNCFLTL